MIYDINGLWTVIKPILFQMDPEFAHHFTLNCLKLTQKVHRLGSMPSFSHPLTIAGMEFPHRVGLAAGMDKNAQCLLAWQKLGFGFIEVGTVTAIPQAGNPKPRLFRLLQHGALYNRMGFNNDGARVISERIATQRKDGNLKIPVGINIGKSAVVPLEAASSDYVESFEQLADLADYVAINVSSPNTKDLRKLQESDSLARIMDAVATKNVQREFPKPLFVKIAPDLDEESAINTCRRAMLSGATGFIISNTTIQPHGIDDLPEGGGGLSGAPLLEPSTKLLTLIRDALGPTPIIIGSGGVMRPENAAHKLRHGAHLVQIYSGLVFGGPGFLKSCVEACHHV